jgi:hypothetical protein
MVRARVRVALLVVAVASTVLSTSSVTPASAHNGGCVGIPGRPVTDKTWIHATHTIRCTEAMRRIEIRFVLHGPLPGGFSYAGSKVCEWTTSCFTPAFAPYTAGSWDSYGGRGYVLALDGHTTTFTWGRYPGGPWLL